MIAEKLKRSVLQAAIQGKLTKQLPEDGSARDLLREIQTEKARLRKEGKIRKETPLPEITADEIPFDIPENWCWVRLEIIGASEDNAIVDGPFGSNLLLSDYDPNGKYPVISISNIDEGFDLNSLRRINETKYIELRRSTVRPGDILVAKIGSSYGKVGVYPKEMPLGIIPANLLKITCHPYLSKKYLIYFLKSPILKSQLDNIVSQTAQPAFNMSNFKKLLFPLPPLTEQNRIVESLDSILPEVDNLRNDEIKLDVLQRAFPKKMRDSILQDAVEGKLTEQLPSDGDARDLLKEIKKEKDRLIKEGKIKKEKPLSEIVEDEIPFDIPENWCWVRLGDIANYKKGPFGSSLTKDMFIPDGHDSIKVYEQKNAIQKDKTLGNYFIDSTYYENEMKGFTVEGGDIIISCAGTIGESYILPVDARIGIINQALMRVRVFNGLDKSYFIRVFDYAINTKDAKGKGSAIKNIPPFETLKELLVPLPPSNEQKRIVERLSEIYIKIDRLEMKA